MFLMKEIERFFEKVKKSDGCWEWTGATNPRGYGQIRIRRIKKLFLAHRFSWILHRGEIPEELNILHRCDNPRCVRPHHLFMGTFADNTKDMMKKGRHASQRYLDYMPRGKHHHYYMRGPKLTREEAMQIRKSDKPQKVLAEEYGIASSMVSKIKSGEYWKE